jgi:hypothetical protein
MKKLFISTQSFAIYVPKLLNGFRLNAVLGLNINICVDMVEGNLTFHSSHVVDLYERDSYSLTT